MRRKKSLVDEAKMEISNLEEATGVDLTCFRELLFPTDGAVVRDVQIMEFLESQWSERSPGLGNRETLDDWIRLQAEANPGVDLIAEARRAAAWEASNPTRRKRDIRRFLGGWFGRAQDRPGNGRPRQQDGPASVINIEERVRARKDLWSE
jgi:hypothetical protein